MNAIKKLIRPDLLQFNPYSSARDEAKGGQVWLNANELPWAHEALTEFKINRYPDKQPDSVRMRLAEIYQVQEEQLAFLRGSDEAIDLLTRLFCSAGKDAIMICPPTFGMYAVCAQLQGAEIIKVPLKKESFALDLEAIKIQWSPKVKLIFLCSPNNPSGNLIPREQIIDLCTTYLGKSIIVVDEAYVEFAGDQSMANVLKNYPNLAILRTLSKAYGLAGARLGVLLADPELIKWIKSIMPPYPIPSTSMAAVNKVLSPEHIKKIKGQVESIITEREQMRKFLSSLNKVITVWPSSSNYLLVKFKDAERIMEACKDRGIILRSMYHRPELVDCIRISIGTPDENLKLYKCLTELDNTYEPK